MRTTGSRIYWSTLEHGQWQLYIAKTEKGLCYISSPGDSFSELSVYIQKRFPAAIMEQNDHLLSGFKQELSAYLDGSQLEFSSPADIAGTAFRKQVWETLQKIPYGQTVTYSEIAEQIGKPSAVRAVASAIGANPLLIAVPCHRVISKNGTIGGYRGGLDFKRFLLDLETHNGPKKKQTPDSND